MSDREKLIELISDKQVEGWKYVEDDYTTDVFNYEIADHLVANGVTVQKWIPVSEPPKENGYYMCWVVAYSVGGKKKCEHRKLYWEDNLWLSCAKRFRIEHPLYWMPLPMPPKEGE